MKLKRQAQWIATSKGFFRRTLAALAREELGVTSIEYALLASLIAVAAMASISLLGGGVDGMWTNVANTVAGAM